MTNEGDLNPRFFCMDCDASTRILGERYMVWDEIWYSVVPDGRGMLCVGCLETRLGRALDSRDFTYCSLNDVGRPEHSARLALRLRSTSESSVA